MAAILDFQLAQTWNRIPISLFVLPDLGNMGVAVGILLLSCIRPNPNANPNLTRIRTLNQTPTLTLPITLTLTLSTSGELL